MPQLLDLSTHPLDVDRNSTNPPDGSHATV
jgi:hypothetical protein